MKNKKIKSILLFCFSLFLLFFLINISQAQYGLNETVGETNRLQTAFSVDAVGSDSGRFISSRLGILIGAILSFIGVIFMVLIVFGGVLWMTARGNEQQVEKAKNLIIQAIIGLIIVLSAYAITAFIGRQLTETNPASTPVITTPPID